MKLTPKTIKLTPKTIKFLAQAICGRHGTRDDKYNWPNFIYRSSSELSDFFNYDCELECTLNEGSRDNSVIEFLEEINETEKI